MNAGTEAVVFCLVIVDNCSMFRSPKTWFVLLLVSGGGSRLTEMSVRGHGTVREPKVGRWGLVRYSYLTIQVVDL